MTSISMNINIMDPTVKLIATLTDSKGNPLSGKTINFYYRKHGTSNWTLIGSYTTDNNGKATAEIDLDPGVYDFRAEFPGDEQYDGSSAEVDNVNVGAPAPTPPKPKPRTEIPWWIIIIIIAVALILMLR